MKKLRFILAATAAFLLVAVMFQYGCKKAELDKADSDYTALIAAQEFSNNELVRLIKLTDPPLSDRELMGIMIAASPLDDNIIKELLKRGQPPCSCALSDETLQMILLFNLPLSEHILKELEKYGIKLSRSLLENINLDDLPDMELDKANLLMESLLNLKFGDGLGEVHEIETVTSSFQVPGKLVSGRYFVLSADFITKIEEMRLQCEGAEGSVGTPCKEKYIRGVNLTITTSIDPITGDKIFDVKMDVMVALVMVTLPPCKFGPADYWYWGFGGGGCGPNPAPSSDAAEEIEDYANWNCGISLSCTFLTGFINLSDPSILGDPASRLFNNVPLSGVNDLSPGIDNYYDYWLFYNTDEPPLQLSYHTCMNPSEMNFHLKWSKQFAVDNQPFGKYIVSYDLWSDMIPGPFSYNGHVMDVTYANCTTVPLSD